MQPPTAGPRAGLSTAQVVALIQDTAGVTFSAGLELLDPGLRVVDDLTDDFVGGSVSRAAYATLHGSAQLAVSRPLDWAQAIVRPYLVLTDGTTTARFNLGAYLASTPRTDVGESLSRWDIAGYDILHLLDDPIGEVYAVDAGVGYLTAVEAILTGNAITGYLIDQAAAATVLPTPRIWPLDEKTTWLAVVNDLLASVGYQGIWSDWDGYLRATPYQAPRDRAAEWYYDTGAATSMLTTHRVVQHDFFAAPTRWVAVRSNNIDGAAPTTGDGIYEYVNDRQGPTSVDARGGRVVTRFLSLDAADQTSLVAQAQRSIDADLRLQATLAVGTFPNPLHWHFDRCYVNDPDAGAPMDVLGTQWTLPLDGSDMTHEWSVL